MGYPMLFRAAYQESDGQSLRWRAAEKWLGLLALGNYAWQPALRHFTAVLDAVDTGPKSTESVDALAGRSAALRNIGQLQAATEDALHGWELARTLAYGEGQALALLQLILSASAADDAAPARRWHAQLRELDTAQVPDEVARRINMVDTVALIDVGDVQGARLACALGLDSARAVSDIAAQADFLYLATRIAVLSGDVDDAGSHIRESLQLTAKSGHRLRTLDCLDMCAELCAATNRWTEAITVWAARSAQTALDAMADRPQDLRRRHAALAQAQKRLGSEAVLHAERRGSAMTFHAAVEFAAMLSTSATPPAEQPPHGTGLTSREMQLLTLVAQGNTDAQIAEALFISIRTVRSHLDRIRDKSGCRRRSRSDPAGAAAQPRVTLSRSPGLFYPGKSPPTERGKRAAYLRGPSRAGSVEPAAGAVGVIRRSPHADLAHRRR